MQNTEQTHFQTSKQEKHSKELTVMKCPATIKGPVELVLHSYCEGSLHAQRTPEDLRGRPGSKQPVQKQPGALANSQLNRERRDEMEGELLLV